MKVSELIEKLQELPQDKEIVFQVDMYAYKPSEIEAYGRAVAAPFGSDYRAVVVHMRQCGGVESESEMCEEEE